MNAYEIAETYLSYSNQNCEESQNPIHKNIAIDTSSSENNSNYSKINSASEQCQQPPAPVKIQSNEDNSQNQIKLSENSCESFSLLEQVEISPETSCRNKHDKKKHKKHRMISEERKMAFKSLTDWNCLIDSELNEESLCNYINLCIFPSLWSNDMSHLNLEQRALAFKKLVSYYKYPVFRDQIINFHLNKLKEIMISNLSNSISLKSYTQSSIQKIDKKIQISVKNKWWDYFWVFHTFIHNFVVHFDKDLLGLVIDEKIIKHFLEKLYSELINERRYVLYISKLIYNKMPNLQAVILKQIELLLLRIIHEDEELNGTLEMLDFIYKRIADSEYFKKFAYNVLLPLHKVQTVILFHEVLLKCCIKYQGFDNEFVIPWIKAIVRYCPYGNSAKEILFLNELHEALKLGAEIINTDIWELAIQKLSSEITTLHDKVSTLAINILNSDLLMSIISKNSSNFPAWIIKQIIKIEKRNYSYDHRQISWRLECKVYFKQSNEECVLFERSIKETPLVSSLAKMHDMPIRKNPEAKWEFYLSEAKKINPAFKSPRIPYQEIHVSGIKNMNETSLVSGNLIPSVFLY